MARRESLLARFVKRTPLRWYLPDRLTRMQLIQYAIDALGARTYLEIGVDEGLPFSVVRAPIKIGVDPVAPRPLVQIELKRAGSSYFATTSDAFFSDHAPRVLAAGVDVVFVDGLHTYDQTYRDIRNALQYLNPGGVILAHDCLPASAEEALVASSFEDAASKTGRDLTSPWTGDTWKAIVAVRSGHTPADACVLNCDHGVGVVTKGAKAAPLSLTIAEIQALDYEALARNPRELLGLCRPAQFRRIIGDLRRTRAAA